MVTNTTSPALASALRTREGVPSTLPTGIDTGWRGAPRPATALRPTTARGIGGALSALPSTHAYVVPMAATSPKADRRVTFDAKQASPPRGCPG